jgi:hypothetical protein
VPSGAYGTNPEFAFKELQKRVGCGLFEDEDDKNLALILNAVLSFDGF